LDEFVQVFGRFLRNDPELVVSRGHAVILSRSARLGSARLIALVGSRGSAGEPRNDTLQLIARHD
jgi:hypothetical protein